jgi:hypothetical protein
MPQISNPKCKANKGFRINAYFFRPISTIHTNSPRNHSEQTQIEAIINFVKLIYNLDHYIIKDYM